MTITEISCPERLAAVRRLDLIDTTPEPEFEDLAQLAAAIFEAPMSVVSVIDDKKLWFLGSVGVDFKEVTLDKSFCHYTVLEDDVLVIEDARQDELFKEHPMVVNEPMVRFYVGVAFKTSEGQPVGTLCVADTIPRRITQTQINAMKVLAKQANARVELREQRLELQRALAEAERVKADLATSEARLQAFMDSGPFTTYLRDRDGRFVFYNRVVQDIYGVSPTDWIGRTLSEIFPPDSVASIQRHDAEVFRTAEPSVTPEIFNRPDGTTVNLLMYRFLCPNGDEPLLGTITVDVTEEVKREAELHRYQSELETANSKLAELAATDSLTGLANRRIFDERLKMEFSQSRRKKRALSVMMIDVDNFKQLNDQFGHEEGDICLKQIADLLSSLLRAGDLIARYGGEEFVILLPETDDRQSLHLADRIKSAMQATVWKCMPMTVSGGIATLSSSLDTQQQLINLADEALYAAKHAGKDRFLVADQEAI